MSAARVLGALARTLAITLFVLAAAMAPFALLPIVVRWPSRREDVIAQMVRPEDAPVSPAPHLEVRR
jgi:hypothetical protein